MKYRKWTEEEDRILEECCMLCDRPIDEAVRRLDRSKDAIRLRAYALGVSMKYRKWTAEEDKILEECYSNTNKDPEGEAFKRLDRSRDAIRLRAYTLGVSAVCEKTRDLYAEWVLFNEIRNMLRKLKGEAPVPFSENPFEG